MIRLKSFNINRETEVTTVVYEVTHNGSLGQSKFSTILTLDVVLNRFRNGPWSAKIKFDKCEGKTIPEVLDKLGVWCSRLSEALDSEMDMLDVIPLKGD